MTSVEWIYEELIKTWYDKKSSQKLLEQAKAMEKEQIINAYCDGFVKGSEGDRLLSEEYYNETFKT